MQLAICTSFVKTTHKIPVSSDNASEIKKSYLSCCYTNITFSVQFVVPATITPSKPSPSTVALQPNSLNSMSKTVINCNKLPLPEIIKLPNGEPTPQAEILLYKDFFSGVNAQSIYQELLNNIKWRQDPIKLYGKEILQPRLTAWYGEPGVVYTYSGITMYPQPWTDILLQVKQQVEMTVNINNTEEDKQIEFNSVLLNRYRHGQDSMGWHSDDEPELGANPLIASVSFGETRRFLLRHRHDKHLPKLEIPLNQGSLLIMAGQTQHYWQHQIPKTAKPIGERINLTFRVIHKNL